MDITTILKNPETIFTFYHRWCIKRNVPWATDYDNNFMVYENNWPSYSNFKIWPTFLPDDVINDFSTYYWIYVVQQLI